MTGSRSPALSSLDIFRGFAAIAMVLNHAGFALLPKEAAVSGVSGALVFAGSFAPVLFFFATGFGLGLAGRKGAGHWPDTLSKVGLLLLADQFLFWSRGDPFGLDFFGFIALSTLLVAGLATLRHAERWAWLALAAVLALRFVVGPLVKDTIAVPGVAAFVTGARPQDLISFPLGPWLAYPLAGFLAARHVAGAREGALARVPLQALLMAAALGLGVAGAVMLAGRGGATFFRWGAMGIGFFVLSIGVLAASGLLARAFAAWLPPLGEATALRGVAAFLVVPVHYALVKLLALAGVGPLGLPAYLAVSAAIIVASFWLSRRLAAAMQPHGAAAALPAPAIAVAIVASATIAVTAFSYEPLLAFAAATLGQLATAASLGRRGSTRSRAAVIAPQT